ncbi:MAG: zinc metallopeptidase [Verrucomicrobiaceae bacterium]|nr:zinc metallopeptidase [Verrucomicrobiaceae bacterium]
MVFILLIVIAFAAFGISQWAAGRYMTMMGKGTRATAPTAHTGGEIAMLFLNTECVNDVQIVEHGGVVTDYFDAKRRRLFLRPEIARGTHLTAWATALHEAGHALHANDDGSGSSEFFHRRTCIAFCRYAPMLAVFVVGGLLIAGRLPSRMAVFALAGVLGALVAWNLGTVSVEFAANRRVRAFLERHLEKHPQALDRLKELLFCMAIREVGDVLRSPRYFFLSALPGAGKSRPA